MKRKNVFLKLVAAMALLFANATAGTTCYLLIHQPKFPEKLRKREA